MKKKATKLLAVVAIATSPGIVSAEPRANATASTRSATATAPTTPNDVMADESPTNWNAAVTFVDTFTVSYARARQMPSGELAIVAQPRQMPSGAPACGNVASRAPRTAECVPAPAAAPMLATTNDSTTPTTARREQTATAHREKTTVARREKTTVAHREPTTITTSIARRAQTATRSRVTGDHR